jgi:hypothetical protein
VVNTRFYLLLGSLLFAAVAGLGASVAWLTNSPPAPDLSAALPKGKAVAELTAAAFVAGRPIPVPYSSTLTSSGGEIAAGNGSPLPVQDLLWSGFENDVIENVYFERHTFDLTVLRDPGNPRQGVDRYQLVVPVLLPDGGTPVLGALPYLTAVPDAFERPPFDYGGTLNLPSLPAAVEERLQDWAVHWAADDRTRLQASTPDGDTSVEYIGLGGFTSERVVVLAGVPLENGDWLVRARVELVGPSGFGTNVDMDITMTRATTASPQVVAWGPAGSGVLPIGHNSVARN